MNQQCHLRPACDALARWWPPLALCLTLTACAASGTRQDSGAASAAISAAPAAATQSGNSIERTRQFQHAEALYLSGRLPDAEAAFAQLSRGYPRDARVWLKYGNTLTKQGKYDDAAAAFQTVLTLDPTQGGAAINLALVRLAQAQGALDTALARVPADSPENLQAQSLQRAITTLLGSPHGVAAH
jgi:TolA-binding protein